MRSGGLGVSILLIALGAILTWAVNVEADGIDLNMVGMILMVVGIVGLIATLLLTCASNRTVIERDREIVVDRDPPPADDA